MQCDLRAQKPLSWSRVNHVTIPTRHSEYAHIIGSFGSQIQTWNHSTLYIPTRWTEIKFSSRLQRNANSLRVIYYQDDWKRVFNVVISPSKFTDHHDWSVVCSRDVNVSVYDVRMHDKKNAVKSALQHLPLTAFLKPLTALFKPLTALFNPLTAFFRQYRNIAVLVRYFDDTLY